MPLYLCGYFFMEVRRMVHSFEGKAPRVEAAAFIAWNADIIGEVSLGQDATIWAGASLRGDIAPIVVGPETNIQEGAILHVATDVPCVLGRGVTVGHGAIVHAATVEDYSLIGMGAIILDRAVIGAESIVGAGALVTLGKTFPPRSMIIGSPAKLVRELRPEEIANLHDHAREYVAQGKKARKEGCENPPKA